VAVTPGVDVVTVPMQTVVPDTHLSSTVRTLPSSHRASAQYSSASHALGPGVPGKQLDADTVLVAWVDVVEIVVVVIVVRVPAQLEVVPLHVSSAVNEFPSSHSRPRQYGFTSHEFGPGGAL
jgi:hypothetical protein